MRLGKILIGCAVASTFSVGVAAAADDDETVELDEVIVSGGRTPVDANSFARANTVITGEELEQRRVKTVADALRQVPGLHVSRAGGAGGATAVRIRGSEANHVLVLIDGVETADSASGFEFADLTADQIERIEVLRGPQSALWGAGATAGVINIITKGGRRNDLSFSATVEGGSGPSKRASGVMAAGNEVADFALSVSYLDDEGYDAGDDDGEKDGVENLTFNLKASADLSPSLRVKGTARYTDREIEYDDTASGCGSPKCYVFDAANTTEGEDAVFSLSADWSTFGGALVHTPRVSYAMDENETLSTFGLSTNEAETFKAGYQAALSFGSEDQHTLVGGVEYKREEYDSSSLSGREQREQFGYVAEYRGDLTESLFVQLSGRFDQNDQFEDSFAWAASASYGFFETGTRLHGSIGQAQTNPTFFEQFGDFPGFFVGNPSVKPEENFGWDLGVEQTLWEGRAVVDVTYFNEVLTDEIATIGINVDNLNGDSDRQGVEASLTLTPVEGLLIKGSYTYLEAKEPDGSAEVRRPRHSGGANVAYTFFDGRATIGADATYFGDNVQRDFSALTNVFPNFIAPKGDVAGYFVVDLNASFAVTEQLEIFGSVENVFDNSYQEVQGFGSQPIAAYLGATAKF